MDFTITPMRPENWPRVRKIYLEGIATGIATFETEAPSWEVWEGAHLPCCRLVISAAGEVCGWAALSSVSHRPVYRGVAETSLYVAAAARGKSLGRRLLAELIVQSEQNGIWTLQAVIFAVNGASLALHQTCGFRTIGYRERIAQREGVWHNTVLMERRSPIIGL